MSPSNSWQFLTFQWNASQDGWMLYIGIMAAVASSLIGSFLVLRKMSMLGDAISHAVLPGLAIAFFHFASSREQCDVLGCDCSWLAYRVLERSGSVRWGMSMKERPWGRLHNAVCPRPCIDRNYRQGGRSRS